MPNCKDGNIECGGRCLPAGQVCRSSGRQDVEYQNPEAESAIANASKPSGLSKDQKQAVKKAWGEFAKAPVRSKAYAETTKLITKGDKKAQSAYNAGYSQATTGDDFDSTNDAVHFAHMSSGKQYGDAFMVGKLDGWNGDANKVESHKYAMLPESSRKLADYAKAKGKQIDFDDYETQETLGILQDEGASLDEQLRRISK